MKAYKITSQIEITNESGAIVLTENFQTELSGQHQFDALEKIRYPHTYKNLTMNLSEFYDSGMIGTVRLIVNVNGNLYTRRELYRKA